MDPFYPLGDINKFENIENNILDNFKGLALGLDLVGVKGDGDEDGWEEMRKDCEKMAKERG